MMQSCASAYGAFTESPQDHDCGADTIAPERCPSGTAGIATPLDHATAHTGIAPSRHPFLAVRTTAPVRRACQPSVSRDRPAIAHVPQQHLMHKQVGGLDADTGDIVPAGAPWHVVPCRVPAPNARRSRSMLRIQPKLEPHRSDLVPWPIADATTGDRCVRFLGCCGHQSAEPDLPLGIDVDPRIEQALFSDLAFGAIRN
jgi:hypothetical protein